MKEFLSREQRAFTVRNVEEDESAYETLMSLGFRVVPVTFIDGRAIKGFDEPALRAALGASEP
ncbi:MAG: glutaredoxin family protein [Acidobacteria bacterium]|nr:glutaredoxin family protein [Acidobacteriota bacterium]MBW8894731.1 glutaredoxin family protein [Acidobacteriota bacterium]